MRYAIIENNIVVNLIEAETGFNVPGMTLVPADVSNIGWIYDGSTLSEPESPPVTSDDLVAYAANKRFEIETAGISVGGALIETDRGSQAMINGAYSGALRNPDTIIKFRAKSGFVTLDATTMIAIGDAVFAHVQGCFSRQADVEADIESGTITTFGQIDDAYADLISPA